MEVHSFAIYIIRPFPHTFVYKKNGVWVYFLVMRKAPPCGPAPHDRWAMSRGCHVIGMQVSNVPYLR